MVRPDLVVVVCTYNGAAHVAEQIDSICRQRVLPSRIAVFDDDSTDGTVATAERAFAGRPDAAVDVVLSVSSSTGGPRLGAARNFQRAILGTTEPLIALSDQDDVWHPDRLERAVAILDADPAAALVASDALLTDEAGRRTGGTVWDAQHVSSEDRAALERGEVLPVLLRQNIAPGMTFTMRRAFAEAHLPLPDGVMHDYWLLLAAASLGAARVIAEPLIDYRLHGSNAIGLGNSRLGWRRRLHTWRIIARTPLTDYAQWAHVVDRLQQDDPGGHLEAARQKAEFELRRRYVHRRRAARGPVFLRLVGSDGYRRFEHTGVVGAVKDVLRPSAEDTATASRTLRGPAD